MMRPIQTISVKHNFEMAHRLWETPGKCQRIHGHSFQAELEMGGEVTPRGLLCGLDFGEVKAGFRNHLDSEYDHAIMLNAQDEWAGKLHIQDTEGWVQLPGLHVMSVDPTTENLAARIGLWAQGRFQRYGVTSFHVTIWETNVNRADWWNYVSNTA